MAKGSVITCDGFDGSGKSQLARALADQLGAIHIELDNFLNRERGRYVEEIRYPELTKALDEADRAVVLEGICVQKILGYLGVVPAVRVYVRKLKHGYWYEGERYLPVGTTADEVINELRKQEDLLDLEGPAPATAGPERETLLHQIIRYHYEFEPHRRADYVYDRVA